jgi:DNA-binding MarR family transcriptional regulator
MVSVFYDAALKPAGVTVSQYALLARIGRVDGLSRTALAAQLGMDRTTLSRNLLPMERRNLVASQPGGDRREKLLHLTPAGRKCAAAARPYWLDAQRKILTQMGGDRLREVRELLAETEAVLAVESLTV